MSILIRINKDFNVGWIETFVCIACVPKTQWDALCDRIISLPALRDAPLIDAIMYELVESASVDEEEIRAFHKLFGNLTFHGNVDIVGTLEDLIEEALEGSEEEKEKERKSIIIETEGCEEILSKARQMKPVVIETEECNVHPLLETTITETVVDCRPLDIETY